MLGNTETPLDEMQMNGHGCVSMELLTKQVVGWFWPIDIQFANFCSRFFKTCEEMGREEEKNGENRKVLKVPVGNKMHAVKSCTFFRAQLKIWL